MFSTRRCSSDRCGKWRAACTTGSDAIPTIRPRRGSTLVDIRRNNVPLSRSLLPCAEFQAGEPARLTIRLADLVVTEWVLGCDSQLLTRAHGLGGSRTRATHLVLSLSPLALALARSLTATLGPTSYDTPPPAYSFSPSAPPATFQSSLPSQSSQAVRLHATLDPISFALSLRGG